MTKPPFQGWDVNKLPVYDLSGDQRAAATGDQEAAARLRTAVTLQLAALAKATEQRKAGS